MSGFQKFVLRGNVVDLAIAVVVATAFTAIIQALVKDFITPLIGMFGGVPDFGQYYIEVNNSRFLIGDFVNAVLTFLVITAVLYFFIVVPYTKMIERFTPTASQPLPTKNCPQCLSKIPVAASRCAFCTSDVSAPQSSVP